MSLNKDYLLSFVLSLAFWIGLITIFNISLKAQKPKETTLILLPAPKILTPPKPLQHPIKQLQTKPKPRQSISKPHQSISKPIHPVKETPKPKNITPSKPQVQNTPKPQSVIKNIASKAPQNIPSVKKYTPKEKPSTGDYFKNAYSPPKVLYNPKPHIPQELLPNLKELSIRVRFYIKKDGSANPVLLTPTPNPELNAILKKSLSNWKFFPATKDQKPIDSTMDITIHIRIE